MLPSLKVRGPFRGPSGYDHHTREFVRELVRQGVAVELLDLSHWGPGRLADHQRDPFFESLNRPTGARLVLHFATPHLVEPDSQRVNVDYTMFEATRIPALWVAHNLRHDLVILPTESSRRAWLNSGVSESKIRLCPLGINPEVFGPPAEPLPLRRDNGEPVHQFRTRFLNVSELGPRKNLVGLVRAWIRATNRGDDAILIMKLGDYIPGWTELFRFQLTDLQKQLGKSLAEAAPVQLVRRIFADAEMPRLYATATHYISLSFGEGWDQAMVEAAASGLKLIAPDHSAYPTYLDPAVARLIPSREVPVVFPGDPATAAFFAGANWWEPNEEAAVEAIREAIDVRDAGRPSARERILTDFTWERATRRLVGILDETVSSLSSW